MQEIRAHKKDALEQRNFATMYRTIEDSVNKQPIRRGWEDL